MQNEQDRKNDIAVVGPGNGLRSSLTMSLALASNLDSKAVVKDDHEPSEMFVISRLLEQGFDHNPNIYLPEQPGMREALSKKERARRKNRRKMALASRKQNRKSRKK